MFEHQRWRNRCVDESIRVLPEDNAGLHNKRGPLEHEEFANIHPGVERVRAIAGGGADKQVAEPEAAGELREEHKAGDGKELVGAQPKVPEADVKAKRRAVNDRPARFARFVQGVDQEADRS